MSSTPTPSQATSSRPAADLRVGTLCAVLSVLLFSSFTLVSRLGLASALDVPDVAALRFGIGGALLLPVLVRHGGLRGVAWRDAVALACCGGFGFAMLAYVGFSLAPAAHGAVLLHGTLPLSTRAVLAASERRAARPSLWLLVIAAGILVMAGDSLASARGTQLAGDGCLLLASASWSAYGVRLRRLGLAPAHAAAIVAVLSMCVVLPLYALFHGCAHSSVGERELLLQALVQGVLIGVVSISVYTRAVATLGAAEAALFTAAVPCVTTLAAVPLLGESPTRAAMAGMMLVTLGMIASLRRGRGVRKPSPRESPCNNALSKDGGAQSPYRLRRAERLRLRRCGFRVAAPDVGGRATRE